MFKNNTIDEALEAIKIDKLIIVSDGADRGKKADLICAAEFATTENINFMATNAKGLTCTPISEFFC